MRSSSASSSAEVRAGPAGAASGAASPASVLGASSGAVAAPRVGAGGGSCAPRSISASRFARSCALTSGSMPPSAVPTKRASVPTSLVEFARTPPFAELRPATA